MSFFDHEGDLCTAGSAAVLVLRHAVFGAAAGVSEPETLDALAFGSMSKVGFSSPSGKCPKCWSGLNASVAPWCGQHQSLQGGRSGAGDACHGVGAYQQMPLRHAQAPRTPPAATYPAAHRCARSTPPVCGFCWLPCAPPTASGCGSWGRYWSCNSCMTRRCCTASPT